MESTNPPPPPHNEQEERRNASLFVRNLHPSVTESQLYRTFSPNVVSTWICRDHLTKSSRGYGFVDFDNPSHASKAMELLNFTQLNGWPMQISFSNQNRGAKRSEHHNVFVHNLDTSVDDKRLHDTFSLFGTVLHCNVVTDSNGQSKGFGFVQFEQAAAAINAIKSLNGLNINDKQLYAHLPVHKKEIEQTKVSHKFIDLYVKNFSVTTTDEDLKKVFRDYGIITNAVVVRNANGNSRGFGFVSFWNSDAAAIAVEKVNGTTPLDDKVWYVGEAVRKCERDFLRRGNSGPKKKVKVKNLVAEKFRCKTFGESSSGESLEGMHSDFGNATSCKARSEIQVPASVGPPPSGIPGYHTLGSRFAPQQLAFGQAAYGFPCQPAHAFQQQLLRVIWPGVTPNFVAPPVAYPQFVHRSANQEYMYMSSGWNVASPALVPQAFMRPLARVSLDVSGMPLPLMNIQRHGAVPFSTPPPALVPSIVNQGSMYTHNMWNVVNPPLVPPDLISPVVATPLGVSRMHLPPVYVPRPVPMSMLAFTRPELQRLMFGKEPFPLFECLDHDHVGELKGSPRAVFFSGKTISIVFAEHKNKRRNSEKKRTVVQNHQSSTTCRNIICQIPPRKQSHFRSEFNAKQCVLGLSSSSRETGSCRSTCVQDIPLIAEPSKDGKTEVCKQGMLKTEMCNNWERTGGCPYGYLCRFAHGIHELRPVMRYSPYKTDGKTEVCKQGMLEKERCNNWERTGSCPYGNQCRFAHGVHELRPVMRCSPYKTDGKIEVCKQGMPKTEMCNNWERTSSCPYGNQCRFAHGIHELRPIMRYSPYKTVICRLFSSGGTCPYGNRCHFRHSLDPNAEGEVVVF